MGGRDMWKLKERRGTNDIQGAFNFVRVGGRDLWGLKERRGTNDI